MYELNISTSTPRTLPSNLGFGKESFGKWFFAYFLFLIGLFGFIMYWTIGFWRHGGYLIFTTMVLLLGAVALIRLYKKKWTRKQIFIHGTIVYGTIRRHDEAFSAFKSRPDYAIIISYMKDNQTQYYTVVVSDKKNLEYYPVGSQIIGLYHNNQYLFPMELSPVQSFHITE